MSKVSNSGISAIHQNETELRRNSLFPSLQTLRRYVQFCLVGGSGVLVDMVVLWGLSSTSALSWNLTLSKAIAAEVAMCNNFFWNDVWTFRGVGSENTDWIAYARRFGKFNVICLMGTVLSIILLNVQVYRLHMNVYLANFVAIVLVSFWNFWINLQFGWGRKSAIAPSPRSEVAE